MGQVLHGCARTTQAVRIAIQGSQESIMALAMRHGVSPTTIQKRRKRPRPRCGDGAKAGPIVDADAGTGGRGGGVPPAYAAAARRLPVRPAAVPAASEAVRPAPLPAAMTSPACPRSRATSRVSRSSRPTRLGSSTSTMPRSAPARASSICSSPSTGPRSSPSRGWRRRPTGRAPWRFCTP